MRFKIEGIKEVFDYIQADLVFNYDTVADTFSFTTPLFEHWGVSKALWKPLTYKTIHIYTDSGNLLLTGTILNSHFKSNNHANEVSITGYSKTGILEDLALLTHSNYINANLELGESYFTVKDLGHVVEHYTLQGNNI